MSDRQTRHGFRSRLDTPGPSGKVQRSKVGSDEGSSTSTDESGGEAWNSKNDGTVIEQKTFGEKRRRTGRGRGMKREKVDRGKKTRRKRVKSESVDNDAGETMDDKATQQEEEEMNATAIDNEDQGNQAESEDNVQEEEVTTRRSGRATKTPDRFDEVRFQPYRATAQNVNQVNPTKALGKSKEPRAPSAPRLRGISPDGSPDPIASFSDDHDMSIDPVDDRPIDEIPISTDLPNSPVNDEPAIKPKIAKARKSALKSKHPTGPRKKRGKVTIDESKNSIRTIKVVSSTSSDIGRRPSLPNLKRGPKRYGVRSRKTVPVMGISPYTGKQAVQSYEYAVSSDSTESEEEEIDPAEFKEWIKSRKEQERKNGSFLLTLAARISDLPTPSSTTPPLPPTLPPPPEMPVWTKPFSLTPIRPPPPINPNHPSNQEQERVWNMFIDCACTKWEEKNDSLLRQVKIFQPAGSQGSPLAPGALGVTEASRAGVYGAPKNMAEEGDMTDLTDSRQELGMLAGSQASLPEPIPRPRLDFEKSCERLAGLEIADRAMGMRLHIPEKRSTKF